MSTKPDEILPSAQTEAQSTRVETKPEIELKQENNEQPSEEVREQETGSDGKINIPKDDEVNEEEYEYDENDINFDVEEYTKDGMGIHHFKKDKVGKVLFYLIYFFIFMQMVGVYLTYDFRESSYLHHLKIYFFFSAVMAMWSHYKAGTTNPGKIVHHNNESVINFYLNVRDTARKNGKKFHDKLGHVLFKKKPTPYDTESDEEIFALRDPEKRKELEEKRKKKKEWLEKNKEEEKKEESDQSSYDSKLYRPLSAIGEEALKKIETEYKIVLNRCKQCYVVRIMRAHHCSKCRGCIMKMDMHCPWINNCVGQFNQKFFIQFCWYSFTGVSTSFFIGAYYNLYRHYNEALESTIYLIFICLYVFFGFLFFIFTFCMLREQWNSLNNDTTLIESKRKLIVEYRSLSSVMKEVFGGDFSHHWFLPINPGGYLPFFKKIHTKAN